MAGEVGVSPEHQHMWHLDNNPYNRADQPGEPRSYVPARNSSYVPQQAPAPHLDRHLAQSLDAVDSLKVNGRPPIPPGHGSRASRSNMGPIRPSRRSGGNRNSGHWNPPGSTTTHNDFVFFSPSKPPPAGLPQKGKAFPEHREDDEDDDNDENEGETIRTKEKKPFISGESPKSMGEWRRLLKFLFRNKYVITNKLSIHETLL